MKTKITELFGCKYPIFQGGMAWIAESTLASAVTNAGGVGIIAGGSAPIDYLREQIRICKEKVGDKPFGVNIMLMSPNAEDLAQLVIDEKVPMITTGAGNPGKYMAAWKEAGIKVVPVVPSVALARRMERSGADAIIAEGMESGGHIGQNTTMCLVPQVVDAVSVPVRREIAVAAYACLRELLAQFLEEVEYGCALFGGARVLRFTGRVQTADIADADGCSVVALYVCPDLGNIPADMNRAVRIDDVVISDFFVAGLAVPSVDVLDRDPLALLRGAAMQHDVCNSSHFQLVFS